MWIEKINEYCSSCEFFPPAKPYELAVAENKLQLKFHPHLAAALLESNGVLGVYGLGLLWNVDRILADNLYFRGNQDFKKLYMPFDHLLFFADAGNGDQFAFAIQDGEIRRDDIFVWNHEEDSRVWVAPHLLRYFEWWLSGDMKI